jgi:hypothetical protein
MAWWGRRSNVGVASVEGRHSSVVVRESVWIPVSNVVVVAVVAWSKRESRVKRVAGRQYDRAEDNLRFCSGGTLYVNNDNGDSGGNDDGNDDDDDGGGRGQGRRGRSRSACAEGALS